MSNVRSYSDTELLGRLQQIGGYTEAGKYLVIGVQSTEDAFNLFDDKFYLFDGDRFIMASTGTTNSGKTALKEFDKYNLSGAVVWKTNQFVKDCFVPGLHKGKMKALRQNRSIEYYRDSNKDSKCDETGTLNRGIVGVNMHGVDYAEESNIVRNEIGGWSFGCQVWNNMKDYKKMIKLTWERNKPVSYALLKEF